jgi:hypothetical protein
LISEGRVEGPRTSAGCTDAATSFDDLVVEGVLVSECDLAFLLLLLLLFLLLLLLDELLCFNLIWEDEDESFFLDLLDFDDKEPDPSFSDRRLVFSSRYSDAKSRLDRLVDQPNLHTCLQKRSNQKKLIVAVRYNKDRNSLAAHRKKT